MGRVFGGTGAVVVVALAAGCEGGTMTSPGDAGKVVLAELGEALKTTAAFGKKPPVKLAELEPIEPMIPVAGPAIRAGELVYLWGAGYSLAGTKVVAYEKRAEADGGWVLLQDGTVKRMTADELKVAEKDGKKS